MKGGGDLRMLLCVKRVVEKSMTRASDRLIGHTKYFELQIEREIGRADNIFHLS